MVGSTAMVARLVEMDAHGSPAMGTVMRDIKVSAGSVRKPSGVRMHGGERGERMRRGERRRRGQPRRGGVIGRIQKVLGSGALEARREHSFRVRGGGVRIRALCVRVSARG